MKLESIRSLLIWLVLLSVLAMGALADFLNPTPEPYTVGPHREVVTLRAAAVLTTSYVQSNSTVFRGSSHVRLFFNLTQGSLTSFEYRVWTSPDGVTWYQEANETVTATIITDSSHYYQHTLGSGDVYYKDLPMYGLYFKLDVKGTGTVTGSSCAIYAMGVE